MDILQIIKPDDGHVHFRDHDALQRTVNDHAHRYARAIIMPNLSPPIRDAEQAIHYRQRILRALSPKASFEPLMTLYLTEQTTPAMIHAAKQSKVVIAGKLYPAGVTTGSEHGIQSIEKLYPALAAMEEQQIVLCIHGEVNDPNVDVFDREARFIEQILPSLIKRFPTLKIVLEHITTQEAVDFVSAQPHTIGATITPHHLALNRNDLLGHGIRPHYFCLPILKRRTHQLALLQAATQGNPHFFLGTDSAPHTQSTKLSACGCAGIYSGCHALEIYAQLFNEAGALPALENFASRYAAQFYGLPINQEKITLVKEEWTIPDNLPFNHEVVVPMWAGLTLKWKIQS